MTAHFTVARNGNRRPCNCAQGADHLDKTPRAGGMIWLVGILAGIVIMLVAFAMMSARPDEGSAARGACEEAVKNQLKAPATAQFSSEFANGGIDGSWDVSGNVDAENGFSALVRLTWRCTVSVSSAGVATDAVATVHVGE